MDGVNISAPADERIRLIDWRELGIELRRHGFRPYLVAEMLHVHRNTVLSWFNEGTEPLYSPGRRCELLFIEITGKSPPQFNNQALKTK